MEHNETFRVDKWIWNGAVLADCRRTDGEQRVNSSNGGHPSHPELAVSTQEWGMFVPVRSNSRGAVPL